MPVAAKVHPSAIIDADVELGEGTTIWHFCHVSSNAKVGANCTIGQNVFIGEGVKIGAGTKIQNNVSVYSGVELGRDVFVGPSVVFTNVINPRAAIERKTEFRRTRVGQGVTIGANATIVCGHTLGDYCFVGAGSVVTRDVAPYSLVVGNPAKHVGWVDQEGNRVSGPPKLEAPPRPLRLAAPSQENAPLLEELKSASHRVLKSGHFILGEEVSAFEEDVSNFLKVEHSIACSSGTDALLLSLMALGIGPGDEVITSPFSFFSTVECILRVGATPVFVDLAPGTFHLDTRRLSDAISSRTRAVIPVHLFGEAHDTAPLHALAETGSFTVVEDAAQSFGAQFEGQKLGTGNSLTCFSFFPSKNLGGFGDGGLIATDCSDSAARLRSLRQHGTTQKYHHERLGGNFRLDALQAALLRTKLPYLPALLKNRETNAALYSQRFAAARLSSARLRFPKAPHPGHTFNQFVIQSDRRDALFLALKKQGIETGIYYPSPLHRQPALGQYRKPEGRFPNAEAACRSVLALPCHPALLECDVERVAQAVVEFLSSPLT